MAPQVNTVWPRLVPAIISRGTETKLTMNPNPIAKKKTPKAFEMNRSTFSRNDRVAQPRIIVLTGLATSFVGQTLCGPARVLGRRKWRGLEPPSPHCRLPPNGGAASWPDHRQELYSTGPYLTRVSTLLHQSAYKLCYTHTLLHWVLRARLGQGIGVLPVPQLRDQRGGALFWELEE